MKKHPVRPDPRELPAYRATEAARYLGIPVSTVRWWCLGRAGYERLIEPACESPTLLVSFVNLVELHILAVIRREHEIKMAKVRTALDFLRNRLGVKDHPLIHEQMQTDGVNLFVEKLGALISVSQRGQSAMKEVLQAALKRIDRDVEGNPIRLYPFTRRGLSDAPRMVVIDARLAGGRPVIAGTGLSTDVIAERYKAGDSVAGLVEDYGRTREEIEEAIRCELQAAA
jgi:uncharacterized protein (DUF433 family)